MYSSSNAATSVDNAHADDKTKQAARLWRGRIKKRLVVPRWLLYWAYVCVRKSFYPWELLFLRRIHFLAYNEVVGLTVVHLDILQQRPRTCPLPRAPCIGYIYSLERFSSSFLHSLSVKTIFFSFPFFLALYSLLSCFLPLQLKYYQCLRSGYSCCSSFSLHAHPFHLWVCRPQKSHARRKTNLPLQASLMLSLTVSLKGLQPSTIQIQQKKVETWVRNIVTATDGNSLANAGGFAT